MIKKWTFNPFEKYKGNLSWLSRRTIFITVHGSQAYNTNIPGSDIDVKGIIIPPKEYYYSFSKNFEQVEEKEPYDMVLYKIQKFFKLAADGNPNIIEIINTDPEDWIIETPLFQKIYEKRKLFLSKKIRYTFSGYATSQLKKIKTHKKWLLEPPTHNPTREEFGLSNERKISQSQLGATKALIDGGTVLNENVMQLFTKEQQYQSAKRNWSQYQNWKNNRNPKRALIEKKYGYDCKNALHLVRLIKMCQEILSEEIVKVRRPDAEELKAIRNGAYSYDELIEWTEKQEKITQELYKQSNLPDKPDINKIDKLCQEITEEALNMDILNAQCASIS